MRIALALSVCLSGALSIECGGGSEGGRNRVSSGINAPFFGRGGKGLGCAAGELLCSGACADLLSDPENCGGCGRACPPGLYCVRGGCGASCPGTVCGAECAD